MASMNSGSHPDRKGVDSFEGNRRRLLLEIETVQKDSGIKGTKYQISRMSQLKEEHNNLVDRYVQFTNVHATDPSMCLPNELFICIISIAMHDTGAADSIWDLLGFTLVSTRWQQILISSPGLWNVIAIREEGAHSVEEKLSVALYLSGSAPLSLRLQLPIHNWKIITSFVSPYRDRIAEITLDLDQDDPFSLHGRIYDILEEFGHLPALRRFHCINGRFRLEHISNITHFIERNPQLDEISGIWLDEKLLLSPSSDSITSFYTLLEPSSLICRPKPMAKLRALALQNYSQIFTSEGDADRVDSSRLLLKCMFYRQYRGIFMPLLSQAATTLVKLDLHTTLSRSARILGILADFRVLESLILYLAVQTNESPVVALSQQLRQSSLRSARFNFYLNGWPPPDPETWVPSFVPIVRQHLPRLTELFIAAGTSTMPWALIEAGQFEALTALHLQYTGELNPPPIRLRLPTTLRQCYLVPGSNFRTFHSDSVTSLSISPTNLKEAPIHLSAESWPSLLDLSISPSAINCNDGTFHHLQTLHLCTVCEGAWDYSTQFCRDLALNLECMPALKDLTFEELPEWDIFFILLERYNFRTKMGSTRISSIAFLTEVPPFLRDAIKSLCDGKFITRPPNSDLCWVNNIDAVYDRTLPGCMARIKAQLFCPMPCISDAPAQKVDYNYRESDESSMSDQDLDVLLDMPLQSYTDEPLEFKIRSVPIPMYPETEDEILSSWERREESWQMLKKLVRYSKCLHLHRGGEFRVKEGRVTILNQTIRPWILPPDDLL